MFLCFSMATIGFLMVLAVKLQTQPPRQLTGDQGDRPCEEGTTGHARSIRCSAASRSLRGTSWMSWALPWGLSPKIGEVIIGKLGEMDDFKID